MVTVPRALNSKLKQNLRDVAELHLRQHQTGRLSLGDWGMASLLIFLAGQLTKNRTLIAEGRALRDLTGMAYERFETSGARNVNPLQNLAALRAWTEAGSPNKYELDSVWKAVDSILLDRTRKPGFYELIFGASGIGALARSYGRSQTIRIADRYLADQITYIGSHGGYLGNASVLNAKAARSLNAPTFNMGVSHGMVGPLLYFIDGEKQRHAKPLAETVLAALEEDEINLPSLWPNSPAFENQPMMYPKAKLKNQSAWCYGDPVAGLALLKYSRLAKARALSATCEKRGLEVLRRSLAPARWRRQSLDFHFCHGASGLLHVANRALQITDDAEIHSSAQALLEMAAKPVSRWLSPRNRPLQITAPFFMGTLGAGLVLTSVLSPASRWDRFILLSETRSP